MPDETPAQQLFSSVPPETIAAVIIPLYGFWKDTPTEQLTADVLRVALTRLKATKGKLYYFFVGELGRLPADVWAVIEGNIAAGNTSFVGAEPFANYAQHVFAGISAVLEHTEARIVIGYNPWLLLRSDSIDVMLERVNRGDVAVASGYDLKSTVDASNFDAYRFPAPRDERDFNLDFWGCTRQMLQMMDLDGVYKTHSFLARDWWQTLYSRGFEVVASQFLPVYSFDMDWSIIEELDDFEADKAYFIKKWGFDPSIRYGSKQ